MRVRLRVRVRFRVRVRVKVRVELGLVGLKKFGVRFGLRHLAELLDLGCQFVLAFCEHREG